jgi:hypothetical protein
MTNLSNDAKKEVSKIIENIDLQTGYLDEKKEVVFIIDFSKAEDKYNSDYHCYYLTCNCYVEKWYQRGLEVKNKFANIDIPLKYFSKILSLKGIDVINETSKYKIKMMRLGKAKRYTLKILSIKKED